MSTTIKLKNKNSESIAFYAILILAVGCSFFSLFYYYSHDLILAFGDAKAHLTIARRVLFSLTPSITQLGGIWLPLPHILDLLTVWNNFMYYSGLAGSIISMIAYIITILTIFKAVYFYTKSVFNSVLASLIMIFNPAFLYLQSTPMTESLSIATMVVSVYLLIKWGRSNSLAVLLGAAAITAVSTLSRYDNWFLLPSASVVIVLVELLKQKSRKIAESSLLTFIVLASFGVLIWLLYNQAIFGNALNFANGAGSASWYATNQHTMSKHNILISFLTFTWISVDSIGVIAMVLMALGVVVFFLKNRKKFDTIPAYLFLAPIIFNIISLYFGQSIVFAKQLPPFTLYNTRYGINALPATAFFVGNLLSFSKNYYTNFIKKILSLTLYAVLIILLVFQYYTLFTNPITVLQEVNYGVKNSTYEKVVTWVKGHPTQGLTLLSDLSAASSLSFDAEIPQEKLVNEASGHYWKDSLNTPEKYVSRIVVSSEFNSSDDVWKKLHNNINFKNNYHLIYDNNGVKIYDSNY